MPRSVILGALAVNTVPGTTTVTPNGGVTSLWSASGGTTGDLDRTQANGGSVPGEGDPVGIGWSVSPSRLWGLLTIEILPWLTLATDVEVADCPAAQFGILATAYSSLQAAIDALPATGGVIYVPAGTYRLTSGLTIDKPNVTLIGEGSSTVITPADPENLPLDLLTIRAQSVRLYNLTLNGGASAIDLESGHCGIICLGQDATSPLRIIRHCYFENVLVVGTSRYGLWLVDTILFTAVGCAFNINKGDGVRIQGGEQGGSCTTLRFISCEMSGNGGIGLNIGDETPGFSGQVSETFLGCTFEGNEGASLGEDISLVGVGVNAQNSFKLEFLSCYFEAPGEAVQYMRFYTCPNVTVDNCVFFGNVAEYEEGPDYAVQFLGCTFSRLTSNTMQGIATAVVDFDSGCTDCVEFCNRDLDTTLNVPRIQLGGRGVIGMSRSGVGLREVFNDSARPEAAEEGTLVWVDSPDSPNSKLQVWDGTNWKSIALT